MELQWNICGSGVSRWRCVLLTVSQVPLSQDILLMRHRFRFIFLTHGSVPGSNVLWLCVWRFVTITEQRKTDPDGSRSDFCCKSATLKCFDRYFVTEAGTLPGLHSAGLGHTSSSGLVGSDSSPCLLLHLHALHHNGSLVRLMGNWCWNWWETQISLIQPGYSQTTSSSSPI